VATSELVTDRDITELCDFDLDTLDDT
jgi:hypothetical protein